jgi:hypothetical protein
MIFYISKSFLFSSPLSNFLLLARLFDSELRTSNSELLKKAGEMATDPPAAIIYDACFRAQSSKAGQTGITVYFPYHDTVLSGNRFASAATSARVGRPRFLFGRFVIVFDFSIGVILNK